ILSLETIGAHEVFSAALDASHATAPALSGRWLEHTAIRMMLGSFANDLIESSRARLAASGCASVEQVRAAAQPLVDFSPRLREHHLSLKRLLHRALYNDPRVRHFTDAARATVRDLFEVYVTTPRALPAERRPGADVTPAAYARAICDYIAGMTDRFAIAEHRRLIGTPLWPDDLLGS
ncbi:MAG: deoxyguanosinetriphosphate triphosphohydrolase, partial [Gammaproteobacteria bacterium]